MSKIFGYSNKGGKDWFKSDAYSDNEIEAIKDPEGGSEINLPTAIPSPFARIDLVKNAFHNIAKTPSLKHHRSGGDVIASSEDEKLVSDCLDLIELFFNYDKLSDSNKLRIIPWNKANELSNLKNSSDKQRRYGETLELYLKPTINADDGFDPYNFDLLENFYLVEYHDKIIGCTSPVTFFFSNSNYSNNIRLALYERDFNFQKYLYYLFAKYPILTQRMKVFGKYLAKNKEIIEAKSEAKFRNLFVEINAIIRDSSAFATQVIKVSPNSSIPCIEIFNLKTEGVENPCLWMQNVEIQVKEIKAQERIVTGSLEQLATASDFLIHSNKTAAARKPLVLQNDLNKRLRYLDSNWDNNNKVPFVFNEQLDKRIIPGYNLEYPCLTVSDFLEPYLIRLVYPINNGKFFNGNVAVEIGDDSKGYILPLKKQFFDYFDTYDLLSVNTDKPKIEMIQGGEESVKVILKIPVKDGSEHISFERTYYCPELFKKNKNAASINLEIPKPDEEKNKGVIVEHQFGVTLFPFIKTNIPEIAPFYRVQLVDRDVVAEMKSSAYNLSFYSNQTIVHSTTKERSNKEIHSATSKYFVVNNEFDFIQVKSKLASGIIIPKWKPFVQGNKVFKFAIDFGTTNTHIEYCDNIKPEIRPFDISGDDEIQIATLFDTEKTSEDFGGSGAIAIREMIEEEFLPLKIGSTDSEYKFPQRTVLAESGNININAATDTLADFNIPFIFEKRLFNYNNTFQTNLKWAKQEEGNRKRIKSYFEKLIFLIRNKVLLNGGNLSATEILWFYPTSMKSGRKDDLEILWNDLINKYFNPTTQPRGIPESLAPFYYYKHHKKAPGGNSTPAISVDIGGGTTDVVYFLKNKPLLLTSFKFAANSIFGDGFGLVGGTDQGLARKYVPHFEKILNSSGYQGLLKGVLKSLKQNKSEDVNTFLFSLETNSKITDKDSFSYNLLLNNDEDLKIIFLYFYSAIIYHIADLMKNRIPDIGLPSHIFFSGNGSKILRIISPKLSKIENITKQIIESVFNVSYGEESVSIVTDINIPKETTCKGGLLSDPNDLEIDVRNIKAILNLVDEKGVYDLTYDQIDQNVKNSVITKVKALNALFVSILKKDGIAEDFKISSASIKVFETQINKFLGEYLEDGILFNKKLDAEQGDNKVEETLFFLPIIGAINNLSNHLSDLTPVKN